MAGPFSQMTYPVRTKETTSPQKEFEEQRRLKLASAPPGGVLQALRKNWFLTGLVLSIALARLAPWIGAKGGPLLPEYTVKYGAVSLIFFNSGLTLKSEDIMKAVRNVKLHVVIQGFTLGLVPLVMSGVVAFLEDYSTLNEFLLKGILVVGCMPPPVSSAVILTKAANANDAGAIFNSALGSFLGIFATPALLLSLVGVATAVPVSAIFTTLSLTVVAPIILGQLVRMRYWADVSAFNIPFSEIGSFTLLVIIYTTFCDTFDGEVDVDSSSLLFVVVFVVVLQVTEMLFLFGFCRQLGFPKEDVVCAMFCASHKSLTLGIPMLKIVFSAHEALSLICVPLLVYHPSQILLGGLLAPVLKERYMKQAAPPAAGPDLV